MGNLRETYRRFFEAKPKERQARDEAINLAYARVALFEQPAFLEFLASLDAKAASVVNEQVTNLAVEVARMNVYREIANGLRRDRAASQALIDSIVRREDAD